MNHKVRITLEVDQQFIRLLRANVELTKNTRDWLLNNNN